MRRVLLLGINFSVLVCCLGCGSSAPHTIPVSGTVTFDGKPLSKGTISFIPAGDKTEFGRPATGNIDPQGNYTLSTFKPGDGAVPGKYQVAVVSIANEPSPEEMAEKGAQITSTIPAGYNSPMTSGLRATVEAGGAMTLDFELKTGGAPDSAPPQQPGGQQVDQFGT